MAEQDSDAVRHWVQQLLCLTITALLVGCAGYRFGPTNGYASGEKSVQVSPFENQVLEQPRLGEAVTISLRRQLQQDGTFHLDTHDEGDIIVTGRVVEYDRNSLSYQPRDIITPRDYLITMHAEVTAKERVSGKVLVNQRVRGQTTVRIGTDLTVAERQALPLLAEDLARNATALLVDGSW